MSRKSRRLSPEEERLWKKVADTATPIERRNPGLPFQKPVPKTKQPARPEYLPPRFQVGERATSETAIRLPEQPVRMDRKAFTRMKRGKSSPEARIDLHGMTANRAHTALIAFLLRAHSEQKRLVLVITGKGRTSKDGATMGILKRQVPHWLEQPPLRQIVLQTTEAHQRHGGSGALYVYLRR